MPSRKQVGRLIRAIRLIGARTARWCVVLVAVSAPGMEIRAQRVDTAATKAAILAADRALAVAVAKSGPSAFLDALEAGAAVLFPGVGILRGAAEARAPYVARYGTPSTFTSHVAGAVASAEGTFGCTTGFLRSVNAADTTNVERSGAYLTCWRRSATGIWKIAGPQRSDAPPGVARVADDAMLATVPHSSTLRENGTGLAGAQDTDAAFAKMGSEPAGPGPAFERYAAPDAMFPGSLTPPHGRAEIRKAFEAFPPERVLLWEPTRELGAAAGGLAFTVGVATNRPRTGAGPQTFTKYFTVWRLESDGRWLWIFDLGSPRPGLR